MPHMHSRASDSTEFRLGANDATINLMLASQARMEGDLAQIKNTLAEQKGERRVTVWAAGAVGSALMFLLTLIGKKLGLGT